MALKKLIPSEDTHSTLPANPKKRKLDEANSNGTNGTAAAVAGESWTQRGAKAAQSVPDVSFSVPQRKKLKLEWLAAGKEPAAGGIRAVAPSDGNVEFGITWDDIDQIFCLPVPEKAKRSWSYVVIPKANNGVTAPPPDRSPPEQIVWSYNELTPKEKEAA
ncbi:hypothetical protein LTS18_010752, partial [Coniosporium uncinatum]